jgi:hypothetical protein
MRLESLKLILSFKLSIGYVARNLLFGDGDEFFVADEAVQLLMACDETEAVAAQFPGTDDHALIGVKPSVYDVYR